MATRIQVRRDLKANWSSSLVLASGEIAYETDTGNVKVGDGSTQWSSVPYLAIANLSSAQTSLNHADYSSHGRFYLNTTSGSWTNLPSDMTAADGASLLLVTRHLDGSNAWFIQNLVQFVTGSDTKAWTRAYSALSSSWSAWRSTAHISPNEVVTASITDLNVTTAKIADNGVTYGKLAADILPVGCVQMFAGSAAPSGWFLCNGQLVSRSTYAALFAAIGTTFGSGDGVNTFAVPDLRNRFAVGAGSTGFTVALAGTGGSKDAIVVSHTHTATSTVTDPGHRHTFNAQGTLASGGGGYGLSRTDASGGTNLTGFAPGSINTNTTGVTVATTNASTGSSGTDANLPPYIGMNYIIRAI